MLALVVLFAADAAHASFLSGDALDSFANGLSWFILLVMPPAAIGLFWMVHVLPQKAAEKRHHPQKEAIHVLCLLSLFFGGLLWPFAWLWAYTRPSIVAMSTGTEKHEDYFVEHADQAEAGEIASRTRQCGAAGTRRPRGAWIADAPVARRRAIASSRPRNATLTPPSEGTA